MKARLLIGLLTCIAMLGILVAVGSAPRASADATGNETCGGSATVDTASQSGGQSGTWFFTETHHCNQGKTFSYEEQYSTAANPKQWHDWGNHHTVTSADCTNGCTVTRSDGSSGCSTQFPNYRIHLWWADGDDSYVVFNHC